LAAVALGILLEVVLDESCTQSGGRTFFRPLPQSAVEDLMIAVMGPAAQLVYLQGSKRPLMVPFTKKWLDLPALAELKSLKQRWADVAISDSTLLEITNCVALRLMESKEMVSLIERCSNTLKSKHKLTSAEVLTIIGEDINVLKQVTDAVKESVATTVAKTIRKVIPLNGIASVKSKGNQKADPKKL
jgi:hypothetical protein